MVAIKENSRINKISGSMCLQELVRLNKNLTNIDKLKEQKLYVVFDDQCKYTIILGPFFGIYA